MLPGACGSVFFATLNDSIRRRTWGQSDHHPRVTDDPSVTLQNLELEYGSVSHGLYMKPKGVLRFGERGQNGFSWFGYCALLSPVQQLPRSKVCLLSAYQPSSDARDLSSLATALPPLLWVRLLQVFAPSKRIFDHDARASWLDSDCEPGYRMSKLRSDRRR